ncbi:MULTISPECIES: GNAT family N-acetyltransferase [Bacillaceae]|uniref:GNAT family N-acetyltransferase n=1 Tax=Bacillaceae TaxID=186817 RepID=UPI0006ADE05D|nr:MULTISPECIES: GNAT family N-acetyltransferase [Bacillaceae]ALC87642.1 acetyltransferase [Bacillus sp. FJAT-22090]KQL34975.1 acetyltransferase [Psychrobacillus sp. FJAT-21963]MDF2065311.1 GNAT family N-acetyltransferase [Bacillus sp. Cr_A10]
MEFQYKELGNDVYAYQYVQDGERLGEITWTLLGDVMVMDHTYVSDKLRGQGIAKKLLDTAVAYAREKELKMEAVCSYVVAAFNKSNEYDDVKA